MEIFLDSIGRTRAAAAAAAATHHTLRLPLREDAVMQLIYYTLAIAELAVPISPPARRVTLPATCKCAALRSLYALYRARHVREILPRLDIHRRAASMMHLLCHRHHSGQY
uniref:Uncharacterized protein n=1 Tax=Trichogramma kaykai TaxID=54128 RepID=A0ABD2XIG8_9HYME